MLPTRETFREAGLAGSTGQEYKVVHIFTKKGTNIIPKRRLCEVVSGSGERVVIRAKNTGVVTQVLVKVDDTIEDGYDILEFEACTHTALMGNICCDCGALLEEKDIPKTDSVSMLHQLPDLKIARTEAKKLGKEDINNLLKHYKLVLLVDLDQTLIHTTNDNIPAELKDVQHFQIQRDGPWYHARLRPHTRVFLEKIAKYYELHISTFGVREYAHHIAHFLDPDKTIFGHRILSRNECLDVMSKKANLDSLFPCGDNLVCIIDDRTDVWNYAPNVVQVVPYHFFRHTGDINAPQGLQKKENDDREGIDFKNLKRENIKTVGFPDGKVMINPNDNEEDDQKNYSSDSESDKDTKESKHENKTDRCVNVPTTNSDEEKSCKSPNSTKTSEEPVCLSKSTESLDPEVEEKNGKDVTDKDGESGKSESDQSESDTTKENTESEEADNENKDKRQTRTEPAEVSVPDLKEDIEMDCEEPSENGNVQAKNKESRVSVFDVVDNDDYLLYLEDILKKIHRRFFEEYRDSQENGSDSQSLPDLKRIVPELRREVLKGVNIVFSGVVPQQMKLRDSKAYFIATSLGASVSERLIVKVKGDVESDHKKGMYTTHMVAANLHTEKVNIARKYKYIKVVTPNWLWKCAERWERVEERLFPLNKETEKEIQRLPPHHCFIPESSSIRHDAEEEETVPGPSGRARSPSGTLLDGVNPLMFFSHDERDNMADEVEKTLSDENDDDDSDEDEDDVSEDESDSEDDDVTPRKKYKGIEEDESNSDMWKTRMTDDEEDMENEDELPSVVFRQGGGLPSDDSDAGGESDDGEDLSKMGADLQDLLS